MRLLMAESTSFSANIANNALMEAWAPNDRTVNVDAARAQWTVLYRLLTQEAEVYLLPSGLRRSGLQDEVFTANLGVVIPEANMAVISRYRTHVRIGEESHGLSFFSDLGYGAVFAARYDFEGEADMKRLAPGLYACGHGIRTDLKSYLWMRQYTDGHAGVEFVLMQMTDPKLYHLDCSLFPIDFSTAMVCTSAFTKSDMAALEKHVDIIDVPLHAAHAGATNILRVGQKIYSYILPDETERALQVGAVESMCRQCNLEPVFVDLFEFLKGGAGLSCMTMHLTWDN